MSKTYALVSCSDKRGVAEFLKKLSNDLAFIPIATTGTREFLKTHQIQSMKIEDFTGIKETTYLKTIHPKIFEAIFPSSHHSEGPSIPIVIVSLYSIGETFNPEEIDLGGQLLLRTAAKSALITGKSIPVCDPEDFPALIDHLKEAKERKKSRTETVNLISEIDPAFKFQLAQKVFDLTAEIDQKIAERMAENSPPNFFPPALRLNKKKTFSLKYGENPHQKAAFYGKCPLSVIDEKLLSKTNLEDIEAGLFIVKKFDSPCCAIVKHTNPCGVAAAQTSSEAFQKAFEADSKSAFGGVLVFNQVLDLQAAKKVSSFFFSLVAAPDFTADSLEYFRQKKSLILVKLNNSPYEKVQVKQVLGGLIYETTAPLEWEKLPMKVVTKKHPTLEEKKALIFAAKVNAEVKSNSIVIAKEGCTLGIGSGQQNRVGAVEIAIAKAGKTALGSVASSDGFFPFPDSIRHLAHAGIQAVIQPGGSKKDEEVIAACNEEGISMIFTGVRVFKH